MDKDIFEVGLTLSVESYYKTHHSTQVLGWEKDIFLLTKAIYAHGKAVEMQKSDSCKVRFLKDGIAYGFVADIVAVQFYPFPLLFLKYPDKIETMKLRVAPRYKINLPASFSDASGALIAESTMIDISEGGCGLKVPVPAGKELPPDAGYHIAYSIMDRQISVNCKLRKLEKGNDTVLVGLEYTEVSSQQKEILNMFLDFLKKNIGTS